MEEIIQLNGDGSLSVPDTPVIPYISGDGTGPDIWNATRIVLDEAVKTAYGNNKKISFNWNRSKNTKLLSRGR